MRLVALLSLLALAACGTSGADLSDVDVSTLSHDPAALVGTWDLVRLRTSGEGSRPMTIAAAGQAFSFAADGTATVSDGEALTATTWRVDPEKPTSLVIGGRDEYFGVDGDRLYFDDRAVDGDLREYRRRAAGGG